MVESDGTRLVEANPDDTLWGIGLSKDDPKSDDLATWNGRNLMGDILTLVRGQLMEWRKNVSEMGRKRSLEGSSGISPDTKRADS